MIKSNRIYNIPNPSLCRENRDEMATWIYALAAIETRSWETYINKYEETGRTKIIVLKGSPWQKYFTECNGSGNLRCEYEYEVNSIDSNLKVNDIDFAYMARGVFHNLCYLRTQADMKIRDSKTNTK